MVAGFSVALPHLRLVYFSQEIQNHIFWCRQSRIGDANLPKFFHCPMWWSIRLIDPSAIHKHESVIFPTTTTLGQSNDRWHRNVRGGSTWPGWFSSTDGNLATVKRYQLFDKQNKQIAVGARAYRIAVSFWFSCNLLHNFFFRWQYAPHSTSFQVRAGVRLFDQYIISYPLDSETQMLPLPLGCPIPNAMLLYFIFIFSVLCSQ